jgi:hypothetical protein
LSDEKDDLNDREENSVDIETEGTHGEFGHNLQKQSGFKIKPNHMDDYNKSHKQDVII